MSNGTKQEMTVEEFAEKYCNLGPELTENMQVIMKNNKEQLLADLRSVILGKLYEFAQEFNESSSPYILDGMIEKFLSNNQ